jgi:hypothetical protein
VTPEGTSQPWKGGGAGLGGVVLWIGLTVTRGRGVGRFVVVAVAGVGVTTAIGVDVDGVVAVVTGATGDVALD